MRNVILSMFCIFSIACDNVSQVYPGDAREDLMDGVCVAPLDVGPASQLHVFTQTGNTLQVTRQNDGVLILTAGVVGASGVEVLYRINEEAKLIYGEVVYNPRLERFTLVRGVSNDPNFDIFDVSVVCEE